METGIQKPNEDWVIVEQYLNEAIANKGHEKWVTEINKNPKIKLKPCRSGIDWFFGDN